VSTICEIDFGIEARTAKELDDIAAYRAGVVGHMPGNDDCYRREIDGVQLAGDWVAKWVATMGKAYVGTMVLVGTTPRTKGIAREGKIADLMECGLDRKTAEALYFSPVKYKKELSSCIYEILGNECMKAAFMAHPCECGAGSGRQRWVEAWSEIFCTMYAEHGGIMHQSRNAAEYFNISSGREVELAKAIQYIAGK